MSKLGKKNNERRRRRIIIDEEQFRLDKKRGAQAGKQGGRRTGRRATKRAKPAWHRMHNKCWVTINWSETMEVVGATCSKLCSQASTIELLARIPAELRRSRGKNVAKESERRIPGWRRYCLSRVSRLLIFHTSSLKITPGLLESCGDIGTPTRRKASCFVKVMD
ncbi:hypothetical protein K0M31_018415 [Melipona bicolor]|uniref:Uncharacterized protein n=1 Tax=Melipona bicolor TaxID=60889 RepID=A0AA40G3E2_9HYME|nr:hypothetical protein K0M31_018415 [Melipona bicolor]